MLREIFAKLSFSWALVFLLILILGFFTVVFVDPSATYNLFLLEMPGVMIIFPLIFLLSFAVFKSLKIENFLSVLLAMWIVASSVLRYFSFRDLLYPAILLLVVFFVWMASREAKSRRSRRRRV